tara:strand:+ start:8091 stop:8954 length:864 start_codon:yes stop_codon:yes gene_type:complete
LFGFSKSTDVRIPDEVRPVLELSGPRITSSFEKVLNSSDSHGGIEAFVTAVKFKKSIFEQVLSPSAIANLDKETFLGLCAFIAPVRRRIGSWIETDDFSRLKDSVVALLAEGGDKRHVDDRIRAFCGQFSEDKLHRWVRDLAAELLHFSNMEKYPLMTRWVWDQSSNTGVIREIWYAKDIDHITLDVRDTFETHLVLREELSQFLSSNGVFRDVLIYADLLLAQIYADYISEQGGSFLRTDFSSELDPLEFTRRMLGLDGVDPDSGRTRVKLANGKRLKLNDLEAMN